MTQLDTAGPETAAAPVSQPAQTALASAPNVQGQTDGFVSLRAQQAQLDSLGVGTDTHALFGLAKVGRDLRENGWDEVVSQLATMGCKTGQDFINLYNELYEKANTGTPAPDAIPNQPAKPATGDAPVTLSSLKQLLDEREKAAQQVTERQRMEQEFQQAQRREAEAGEQVITATMKFKQDSHPYKVAKKLWPNCVLEAISESAPAYLAGDKKEKWMEEASKQPASEGQLKRAGEILTQWFKDLANENVAAFATQNNNSPANTLGGGPGGSIPANIDDMDPDQRRAAVIAAAERRLGKRLSG